MRYCEQPLVFVTMTGMAIAIASITGRPQPSPRVGSTKASAPMSTSRICSREMPAVATSSSNNMVESAAVQCSEGAHPALAWQ